MSLFDSLIQKILHKQIEEAAKKNKTQFVLPANPKQGTMQSENLKRILIKIAVTLVGMSGLRLDKRSRRISYVLWVVLFGLGIGVYWVASRSGIDPRTAQIYAVLTWLVYYVGNSIVLATPLRLWMIQKWGEERALRIYNVLLGITFSHQAFAQAAFIGAFAGTLAGPRGLYTALGGLLIVVGFSVKLWATYVSSLDVYYYNDMFLGRALRSTAGSAVTTGPYRWFKNPMYGIGNLQAYGTCLVSASAEGLALCAFYQASIYMFLYLFEHPFFVSAYSARE